MWIREDFCALFLVTKQKGNLDWKGGSFSPVNFYALVPCLFHLPPAPTILPRGYDNAPLSENWLTYVLWIGKGYLTKKNILWHKKGHISSCWDLRDTCDWPPVPGTLPPGDSVTAFSRKLFNSFLVNKQRLLGFYFVWPRRKNTLIHKKANFRHLTLAPPSPLYAAPDMRTYPFPGNWFI